MLKAAFFDLDGTLQDLDTPFHAAVAGVFGPLCIAAQIPVGELESALDAVWPDLWSRVLAGTVTPEALRGEWFRRALPAAGIAVDDEAVEPLAQRYEDAFEGGLRLYPDVLPALTALRRLRPGLVHGLITNGWAVRQRSRAAAVGLGASFDVWVISQEVGSAKPEARIFETALEQARVLAAEAVMVGDDPRTDILGAKAMGLHALWVNRGGRAWPGHIGCVPDGVAPDLSGIVTLIRNL